MKRPSGFWTKLVSGYQQRTLFKPTEAGPAAFASKHQFARSDVVGRIKAIPWFTRCGQPFSGDLTMPVKQVDSWAAAEKSYTARSWEDAQLEARNELSVSVHRRNAKGNWNELVRAYNRDVIDPLDDRTLEPFQRQHGLDEKFRHFIHWTLLNALLENAYIDCGHRNFFFLELLTVFEAGHFPCGWKGKWPKGALIVY